MCDPEPNQESAHISAAAAESVSPPDPSVSMPKLDEASISTSKHAEGLNTTEPTTTMLPEPTRNPAAVVIPTPGEVTNKCPVAAKIEINLSPLPDLDPNNALAYSELAPTPTESQVYLKVMSTKPGPSLTVGRVVEELLQKGPNSFHKIPSGCRTISDEFDPKELIGQFNGLIWGPPLPRDTEERSEETSRRLKEYMGDITDEQFIKLADYCSEEHLRMPYDIKLKINSSYVLPDKHFNHQNILDIPDYVKLTTTRRIKKRIERDAKYNYCRTLKYRGDKTSLHKWMERDMPGPVDLEPGKELLFRVRIYRPFVYLHPEGYLKTKEHRTYGAPQLQQDLTFLGQQPLEELLDRIPCVNDFGPRTDCSQDPNTDPTHNIKETFPSGFLFINGVFYVDRRHYRCVDYSEPIRAWARRHRVGDFECRSIAGVRFDSLKIRLGYPELYMHQGNCEHLFSFSEVSVLQPSDYCSTSVYPYRTALHTVKATNCTICSIFVAKWIVTDCERIPFDPAFICDTCHKQYNYIDGVKVGDFKAYKCFDKQIQI